MTRAARAATVRANQNFAFLEAYSAAAVYYLGIVSILMLIQAQLERRFTWRSGARRRRVAPAMSTHEAR